jgi:hypothetical protein
LFTGLDKDFVRAGGVPVRINQDLREELPNRDPSARSRDGDRSFQLMVITNSR